MQVVTVHLLIFGQVQGVFFRRSAKLEAEKLGVVGWVRNRDDGSVEAVAEGPKDKVDEFVAWCKKGPPFAKVESVEVEWKKNPENFDNFEIL